MKKLYVFLLFTLFTSAMSNAQACFKEIRAGRAFTIALKEDNTLWAWGSNAYHQLGDGTNTGRQYSMQIGTSTWSKFTVGDYHVLAIRTDGTLWGWGRNAESQLTGAPTADNFVPTQIGTDSNWAQITTGRWHSTGIKTDGTLWAWGYNDNGNLGDGTLITKTSPVQLGTANNWAKVYSGYYHTLGIKTDGTLWVWGNNLGGGLGDGGTDDVLVPTQVGTDTNWVEIAAGNAHSIAIKSNGTMWACGSNMWGQLGLGLPITGNDAVLFTQIGTDTNWRKIAVGLGHNLAVKTDGTLWSWGINNSGQIGNGTIDTTVTNFVLSPYQVGTGTDWNLVGTGSHNSFALKTDNMLWAWGFDGSGSLGDHSTTNKPSPTYIDCAFLATLGVDEAEPISASVKVYPNPATTTLNIATKNLQAEELELYDVQGRLILSEKMSGTEHQLNISNLENGTYLLKVSGDNKSETIKVIKN
ncbi:T9SS type A sorting domain-containing protein [Flavobacterium wongokense]|uniref:T9SS type A sorting domain-containing protein n=1 Tax=Flavobacterium wongokense TaxID=2910674 RepID=UPI001F3D0751|nr:T9SS type A sorting domain-containing protein [Flavobacterium sp. WG47]MCF6131927.1 T9SS type A sorting domain-containing protein [Flavobacterium sp. WG47]